MTDTPQLPKPRHWPRLAAFLFIPVAAALALAAVLPRGAKAVPEAMAGSGDSHPGHDAGCTHAADAKGAQACPHGMDANGGCNMNAATGDTHGQPSPSNVGRHLEWTLPKDWTSELNQGGMRYATLRPNGTDKVDVSVVPLGGAAGGELANVNRWRGQIGLDSITEKELTVLRSQVNTQAGPVTVFDLNNPKNPAGRMVVGILSTQAGDTWFVKMAGEHEPVAKAKPAFLKLLESLHRTS